MNYITKTGWRQIFVLLFIAINSACTQQNQKQQTSTVIDSLAAQLEELKDKYRPGLGEIMGGIQMHHAKLWYAGLNNNWKLADYEITEIKERLVQAEEIETNRPEVKTISMIYPAIDSVAAAIKRHNLSSFINNFKLLTNNCNNCHTANHFEFNVITLPTSPPVSNQDFKISGK